MIKKPVSQMTPEEKVEWKYRHKQKMKRLKEEKFEQKTEWQKDHIQQIQK